MSRFQILCTTMHQHDFSKIQEMNIHSDVIFTNQSDTTSYEEILFGEHVGKMITTSTRGVGINRNLGLSYADSEICLLADDDLVYDDNMEERVLNEFDANPNADLIIFNLDSGDSPRKQKVNSFTQKCGLFSRLPYGACRIAFRLNAIKKANVWFTTLFGGGCRYPSGEDSMWLEELKKKKVRIYVSNQFLGKVSFGSSTWFTGRDEKYFFGRGAYYQAVHPRMIGLWMIYFAIRTRSNCDFDFKKKFEWMKIGQKSYKLNRGYEDVKGSILPNSGSVRREE